jgi:hypothetical protein
VHVIVENTHTQGDHLFKIPVIAGVIDNAVPVPSIHLLRASSSEVMRSPTRLDHLPDCQPGEHQPIQIPLQLATLDMIQDMHFQDGALNLLKDGQHGWEVIHDVPLQFDTVVAPNVVCDLYLLLEFR